MYSVVAGDEVDLADNVAALAAIGEGADAEYVVACQERHTLREAASRGLIQFSLKFGPFRCVTLHSGDPLDQGERPVNTVLTTAR